MICVTGAERTSDELRTRQKTCSGADLHELRLDLLDDPSIPIRDLAEGELSHLVVTCRPLRQGGEFDGDEETRFRILTEAVRAGAGFVDVEADVENLRADEILHEASRGLTRIVRSHHVFESSGDPIQEMTRLRGLRGHVLKLAVQVDDAAELAPLLELGRERDRPVVLIGMGRAGVLSRICYRRFGSAWTFAASDDAGRTAEGQVTWRQVDGWGLSEGRDPKPIVLLGGSQVHGSPGPVVYNELFRQFDVPLVYVPVETDRPRHVLALLRTVGFAGGSVTMPLKERVAEHLDEIDEAASAIGAVNTIWCRENRLVGTNTDGLGAARALATECDLAKARALVLGAGGSARAVIHSLLEAGAQVGVHNRTRERAEQLAAAIGRGIVVEEKIDLGSFDILVNATSVGLRSAESPIEDSRMLTAKVVLDCVAQPPRTKLLEQADSVGAVTISGREMWLHQGAAQATLWLGEPIAVERLRPLLPAL